METSRIGRTAIEVTAFGAGGFSIGNLWEAIADDTARETIEGAYDAGLRYFDTAPEYGYGLSERRIGDALRSRPRDDYVLSTKVGILLKPRAGALPADDMFVDPLPFEAVYDYSYDGTMRSFEDSLQRLGLNRIDIVLIHNLDAHVHGEEALPVHFRTAMDGAYKALDALRSQGAISAIGLGVNQWEVCENALEEGDFDCFLLAGRYTLLVQTALDTFLPKCVERGVSIILGAPFNSGILVRPPERNPTYNDEAAPADVIARVQRIRAVCEGHSVPVPAAALQFPMAHPAVVTVIPGIRSKTELAENLALATLPIPADLWRELKSEGLMHAEAPTP
jgi:D-threo-aldose 1-dehydrogenase